MQKIFLFLTVALVCGAVITGCGDKDEDRKDPLKPAYVELGSPEDASLIFKGGEAADRTVMLSANREVEATPSESWVTATVTANGDRAVSVKITVAQSAATKKRTATITLTTKPAEEGDRTEFITINLEQGVFGLPEADLLDIVFTRTTGPASARDISSLQNPVYDCLNRMDNTDPDQPFSVDGTRLEKQYPTVSDNALYGRPVATFPGPASASSNRGSGVYRVDVADYTNVEQAAANGQPLPFRPLGQALTTGSFSIEVLFKTERLNGDATVVGFTQSWGGNIGISEKEGRFITNFYMDSAPEPQPGEGSQPYNLYFKNNADKQVLFNFGSYVHAVAIYDRQAGQMRYHVDGVKSSEDHDLQPGYIMKLANTPSDALAQWIGIGGDARRSDPVIPNVHVNTDWENWAESLFTGDIVFVRIYGKALSDAEVKKLYDYERPE
jgi:hypothetical protein